MRARGLAMVAALLALVLAPRPAAAAKPPADRIWTRPGGVGREIRTIAMLPTVGPSGHFVDDRWLVAFFQDGHQWLPAPLVRDQLARLSSQPDSALLALSAQVFARGSVDAAIAPRLCRAMRVQALLTVRVDRWERVAESNPYLTTAYVELVATLLDSTGDVVWRVSGEERETARYGVPTSASSKLSTPPAHVGEDFMVGQQSKSGGVTMGPGVGAPHSVGAGPPQAIVRPPDKVVGRLPPDFEVALGRLLDRWVRILGPPAEPSASRR